MVHCLTSTINRNVDIEFGSLDNGTGKSIDDVKGYGRIVPTDRTQDLFVHQRNILGDDVKTLPIDAKVTYESRTNDKGLEAINVSLNK